MFAVHLFSDKIGDAEYGIFGTLLAIVYFIGIPSVSLQMVFTRQAARLLTESQQRRLSRTVRTVASSTWSALVKAERSGERLMIAPTFKSRLGQPSNR